MPKRTPAKAVISKNLKIQVIEGKVLGVEVYRGFARLCDLAAVSMADIFDQQSNPTGTQRDLSPKHARDAYDYVSTSDLAFWPEVFLCVRNSSSISFKARSNIRNIGTLTIDRSAIEKTDEISISRVDGNHRLHYADGNDDRFKPITKSVSFCLAYNLTLEQEIELFRDINDNQKRMNTSHLENITVRLTDSEKLKYDDRQLFIAKKLGDDKQSPFYDRVWEGGKKPPLSLIPLKPLKTGIEYMLSQPTKLTALKDPDAQYIVIRNYFNAVKQWQADAWNSPKDYLMLRGVGLWAICFIGAAVIDRALGTAQYAQKDMLEILNSGSTWNWSRSGDFAGYSGRGGAVKISDLVVSEFSDEDGISINSLAKQILKM